MRNYIIVKYAIISLSLRATDRTAPDWHHLADILDTRLAKSKWLVEDNVTIADIAVAAPMHVQKW